MTISLARAAVACGAVSLGLLLVVTGCESVIGADFGDTQQVSCAHAAPPGPPTVKNATGEKGFTAATYALDMGDASKDGPARYSGYGFDLDNACTNLSQRSTCKGATWLEPEQTDGADGRDNGIGKLIAAQETFFGLVVIKSDDLTARIQSEQHAPLLMLRVSGYSGFAGDDKVTVEWFTPARPEKPADIGWDKPEHPVAIDSRSTDPTTSTPTALHVDRNAYVNNYTLVAKFDGDPSFRLANVAFKLHDVMLVAKMNREGTNFEEGMIAGRVAQSELFSSLPEFTQFITGVPICTDNPNYPNVKKYFCIFSDVRVADTNAAGDCDGLSFAVKFQTRNVTLGDVVDDASLPMCPPASDTSHDTCATAPANL
ncbi:MAG: hypothetical protein JWM74_102 [Myxococcaceae bacterium]|nr:hypothetical protein [Myxococcaceae bacterium]